MYDITEKGERQYRRVKYLIYGLYVFIPLMILSGCNTHSEFKEGPDLKQYYDYPVYCPSGYVQYCEGRSTEDMDCQCIERRQQRELFEQLMRTNVA